MIIIPMHTPGCGCYVPDHKSDILICIVTVLIDIVITGLFFGVGYFVYYLAKEQESFGAFLLSLVDLLVLALAILLFEDTLECFKWAKESSKEHKKNNAVKKQITRNKPLNSVENYYDSIDNYVMSLFQGD